MKNLFKKTIVLTYLITFLFSFLIPFNQSLAQTYEYTLKVNIASSIAPGVSTMIVAVVNPAFASGGTVVFYSTSPSSEYYLSQKTCKIPVNGTQCSVSFNSSIEKTFFINAFLHDDTYELDISDNKINSRINSNNIGASIKVEKTTLNCPPSQVPNEAKTACIVPVVNTDTTYTMLAPLPGLEGTINTVDDCPFGKYLNIIIKLIMGISAVLAMVMITMGGIQYITSDLVSNKEAGKETITHAILGLVMMLGAFLILNTVNPKLLNACLKMPTVTIEISPEETIRNRTGGGVCAPITDSNKLCYTENLAKIFKESSTSSAPFNTIAAQASAICSLESRSEANTTSGVDKCSDGKAFSFGLFQINGSAHRNEIPKCTGAFIIPTGHGASQGNRIPNSYSWTCNTHEPEYSECKKYLLDPNNNINYAYELYKKNRWSDWTTYNSCRSKF